MGGLLAVKKRAKTANGRNLRGTFGVNTGDGSYMLVWKRALGVSWRVSRQILCESKQWVEYLRNQGRSWIALTPLF